MASMKKVMDEAPALKLREEAAKKAAEEMDHFKKPKD